MPEPGRPTGSDPLVITGYGHYFPEDRRALDGFPALRPGHPEQAVVGHAVPNSRHVCAPGEGVEELALAAGRQALQDAGRQPNEVDLLILSSWTNPIPLPARAPAVAARLGSSRALAFDLNAACLGFLLGLRLAGEHLRSNPSSVVLLGAADRFSQRVRPGSRGELVCGDGAGAVVLESGAAEGSTVLDVALRSEGELAGVVTVRGKGQWITSREDVAEVASGAMIARATEVLERCGLGLPDIDWAVPHSGTAQVLESLHGRLGLPPEQVLTNYQHRANTGSATIPSSLSEFRRSGHLRAGDLVLAPSVGSGWYSGAMLLRM